jgi:hypothetical protein
MVLATGDLSVNFVPLMPMLMLMDGPLLGVNDRDECTQDLAC